MFKGPPLLTVKSKSLLKNRYCGFRVRKLRILLINVEEILIFETRLSVVILLFLLYVQCLILFCKRLVYKNVTNIGLTFSYYSCWVKGIKLLTVFETYL